MNQAEKTRNFYNKYGIQEWERLGKTPYDRLNFLLHMDFINGYIHENTKVFDVGCGAGRFSIEFAKKGCEISLIDISDEQIRLAKDKLIEFGVINKLKEAHIGNIADMYQIDDNSFDVTVCYGAPLNYLNDNYIDGIKELYRVTKPGGSVFISVNSRFGVIHSLIANNDFDITDFLSKPDYWYIDEVITSGNLSEHPEVAHPSRHMFEAEELRTILENVGFIDIEMASSPCISTGLRNRVEQIYQNKNAWETLIKLELATFRRRTTLDFGEFLLIKGTIKK